jgi:hypothetical protein
VLHKCVVLNKVLVLSSLGKLSYYIQYGKCQCANYDIESIKKNLVTSHCHVHPATAVGHNGSPTAGRTIECDKHYSRRIKNQATISQARER